MTGTLDVWTLTLVPSEPKIQALLKRITVGGVREQVLKIEYLQADGDRTEMTIEPVKNP
ncbi:hypothetical protein D3C86_2190760 [compost metagenome]